ncbi:MAG TPA: transketolase [Myxococcota bacterium]|nr:transketolase [Myxococcota bacterium]HOA14463.1 transketolase [Myxococcota bacterium]HPV04332.1 transketolase [Myxococcota bacterium]
MPLTREDRVKLYRQAKQLRHDIVNITNFSGGAHAGGGLSAIDVLTLLYFHYMKLNPAEPKWADRDRFVLSKGHSAIAYVPTLARRGFFDFELVRTFNKFGSPFGMHPDSNRIPGCDASTGSLGHGLPMAVGMALAGRLQGKTFKTFCLLGDGECNEGVIWEALMAASHYRLTNLITIVDRNHLMIDGQTEDVMGLDPLDKKFEAFGFEVHVVDGHDLDQLAAAIERAMAVADADLAKTAGQRPHAEIRAVGGKPVAIIADTVKGKGVDFMENKVEWHYGAVDSKLLADALASIDRMYDAIFAREGVQP